MALTGANNETSTESDRYRCFRGRVIGNGKPEDRFGKAAASHNGVLGILGLLAARGEHIGKRLILKHSNEDHPGAYGNAIVPIDRVERLL